MKTSHITPAGGNVFADLGFPPEEAAALKAESDQTTRKPSLQERGMAKNKETTYLLRSHKNAKRLTESISKRPSDPAVKTETIFSFQKPSGDLSKNHVHTFKHD